MVRNVEAHALQGHRSPEGLGEILHMNGGARGGACLNALFVIVHTFPLPERVYSLNFYARCGEVASAIVAGTLRVPGPAHGVCGLLCGSAALGPNRAAEPWRR